MTRTPGRRTFLAGLAAGVGSLGGCSALAGDRSPTVSLLAAGSLNNALENGLRPAVDATLQVEARGSAEVARLVAEAQKDPDVVSVADVALFDSPMDPEWYAEFATNSVVVAYNQDTDGGQHIADAGVDGWYRPLLDGDVSLGRTDPDLDPLGYRTLFVLELAAEYYGTTAELRAEIPRREQVYPETQLVSQFETGSVDAAVTYRSMAVDRGYDYVELPPEIDLSTPEFADRYASVSYELPGGNVVSGAPISYASTVRDESPAVLDVFAEQTTGQYLREYGFVVPTDYPRYTGNVPERVTH
ncbi:extracellular solute-binding protein [Halobacterium wangiae]|uniref:extracellular solute-binding protein n=1 Tax=Halobacterium wangiae TaxID=2902623 RepID=UPI001E523AAB|nr:extracellular solute-binding protein [Halobacterium wangiae]